MFYVKNIHLKIVNVLGNLYIREFRNQINEAKQHRLYVVMWEKQINHDIIQ